MRASCLDVAAAANLAFDYFNGHVDRRSGFPFIWTFLLVDPPKMTHEGWDTVEVVGRLLEGLVPLRVMTGSDAGLVTELGLRDKLLACQNPKDGLIYRPKLSYAVHIGDFYDQSSAMLGLTTRYLAERDPLCARAVERMIDALWKLAEWDGKDYARFVHVGIQDGQALAVYQGQVVESDNPTAPDAAWFGRLVRPMLQYAQATGQEKPIVFARALARDIAFKSGRFGDDGSFSRALHGEDSVWTSGHFHSRMNTVAGILRLALHTGDKDLLAWAERVFRWALRHGTDFGWYPEFVGRRNIVVEGCETCGVADMFDVAATLGRAGREDCWEIADRIWRNQLLENQLKDISWVRATRTRPDTEIESCDRVAEKARGGFAGWAAANDFISDASDPSYSALDPTQDHRRSLMGCCSSSGAKALYLAWHLAVEEKPGAVSVNLPVTRECRGASVRAWEPREGRIDVTMKADARLRVRVPGRPSQKNVRVVLGGDPAKFTWEGAFVCLDGLKARQDVRVTYPLAERHGTTTVGGWDFTPPVEYRIAWRGNTVMEMSPPGKHCPLYRRADATAMEPGPAAPVAKNEFEY